MAQAPNSNPGSKATGLATWYIYKLGQTHGPFTAEQILDQLKLGKVAWVDYVWCPPQGLFWKLACEIGQFRSCLPKAPPIDILRKLVSQHPTDGSGLASSTGTGDTNAAARPMVWFLQFEGTEFGPLATEEVIQIVKAGKLKGELFARRDGVAQWTPVVQVPELGGKVGKASRTGEERRRHRRVTVVATAVFSPADGTAAGKAARFMGVCRDVSTSGVLVMSSVVPGGIGSKIRLEIQSAPSSLLPSFKCEATIRRILSDGHGFAVEFDALQPQEFELVQNYIQRTQG